MPSIHAVPTSSERVVPNEQDLQKRASKTVLVIKLIFLGMLLPAFDLGTDLMTIYQHLTSSQWVLNYVAYGLILSLTGHSAVSALYWNWSKLAIGNEPKGIRASPMWKVTRMICFFLGAGNIHVTLELLMEIVQSQSGQIR